MHNETLLAPGKLPTKEQQSFKQKFFLAVRKTLKEMFSLSKPELEQMTNEVALHSNYLL